MAFYQFHGSILYWVRQLLSVVVQCLSLPMLVPGLGNYLLSKFSARPYLCWRQCGATIECCRSVLVLTYTTTRVGLLLVLWFKTFCYLCLQQGWPSADWYSYILHLPLLAPGLGNC